jgi:hypothetical protein
MLRNSIFPQEKDTVVPQQYCHGSSFEYALVSDKMSDTLFVSGSFIGRISCSFSVELKTRKIYIPNICLFGSTKDYCIDSRARAFDILPMQLTCHNEENAVFLNQYLDTIIKLLQYHAEHDTFLVRMKENGIFYPAEDNTKTFSMSRDIYVFPNKEDKK